MLLAIETATNVCSVALKNNSDTIREKRTDQHGHHSVRLFKFIQSLRKKENFSIDELDACLISEGPGSYTGLRIGASGIKGLLFGSSIPLFAVNTLAGMCWGLCKSRRQSTTVHAVIDARRKHLYHQAFTLKAKEAIPKNKGDIRTLTELNERIGSGEIVVGTGWDRLNDSLVKSVNTYGVETITAKNLIYVYDSITRNQDLNSKNSLNNSKVIRRVQPDRFDPNYITSKKPGT